jgi:hypothetical protein
MDDTSHPSRRITSEGIGVQWSWVLEAVVVDPVTTELQTKSHVQT